MYWYYRQGPTATVCATRLTLRTNKWTYNIGSYSIYNYTDGLLLY
jgi:hypothetical protein